MRRVLTHGAPVDARMASLSAREKAQMCLDVQIWISAAMAGIVHLFAWRQIRRRFCLFSFGRCAGSRTLAAGIGASSKACDNGDREKQFQQECVHVSRSCSERRPAWPAAAPDQRSNEENRTGMNGPAGAKANAGGLTAATATRENSASRTLRRHDANVTKISCVDSDC